MMIEENDKINRCTVEEAIPSSKDSKEKGSTKKTHIKARAKSATNAPVFDRRTNGNSLSLRAKNAEIASITRVGRSRSRQRSTPTRVRNRDSSKLTNTKTKFIGGRSRSRQRPNILSTVSVSSSSVQSESTPARDTKNAYIRAISVASTRAQTPVKSMSAPSRRKKYSPSTGDKSVSSSSVQSESTPARNTKNAYIRAISVASTRAQTPVKFMPTPSRDKKYSPSTDDKDETDHSLLSEHSNSIQTNKLVSNTLLSDDEDNHKCADSDVLIPTATVTTNAKSSTIRNSKAKQIKVLKTKTSHLREPSITPIAKRIIQTPVTVRPRKTSTPTPKRGRSNSLSTHNIDGLVGIDKAKTTNTRRLNGLVGIDKAKTTNARCSKTSLSTKNSKPVSNTSLSSDKDEGGQRSNSDAIASTTKLASNVNTSTLMKIKQKMDSLPSTTPVKKPRKTKTKYVHTVSRTVASQPSVRSRSITPVTLRPQRKATSTSRSERNIHGVVAVDKKETNSAQPLEPSIKMQTNSTNLDPSSSNDKENSGDDFNSPGRRNEQQIKKTTPSSKRTIAMQIEARKTNTVPYSTTVISQSKHRSTPVPEDEKDVSSSINSTDNFLAANEGETNQIQLVEHSVTKQTNKYVSNLLSFEVQYNQENAQQFNCDDDEDYDISALEDELEALVPITFVDLEFSSVEEVNQPYNKQNNNSSREVEGSKDQGTLSSMYKHANLMRERGHFEKAKPLLYEVLAMQREVMGSLHEDTLTSMATLALLLCELELFDDAMPLYKETIAGRSLLLGRQQPGAQVPSTNAKIIV